MRKRLMPTVLLSFLVLVTLFAAAQSGADPSPNCAVIGRGAQGPSGEIQCREDALKRAAANQQPTMIFWLAQTYETVGETKAEEYYRRLIADHCGVSPDLCQRAKQRVKEIDSARSTPRSIEMPFTPNTESFAISPDGTQLVYLATVDGKTGLWIHHLNDDRTVPVPDTDHFQYPDGIANPFWSPTGKSIGFFASGRLRRIDTDGANSRDLAEAPQNCGGSWGRDGVILFAPTYNSALFRISENGGLSSPVTQTSVSHRYPQFLSDGRHFLFYNLVFYNTAGPAIGSLDSPEIRSIGPSGSAVRFVPPDQILFVTSEALFAQRFDLENMQLTGDRVRVTSPVSYRPNLFPGRTPLSVSANGTIAYRTEVFPRRQLVWFDRDGRRGAAVGFPDASLGPPRISPDGQTASFFNNPSARLFNLVNGNFRSVPLFGDGQLSTNTPPVWSPDGQSIVYGFAPSYAAKNTHDLYLRALTGNAAPLLLFGSAESKFAADWSWKTGFVLFGRIGTPGLFAVAAGGGASFLVAEDGGIAGRFSPDGGWVAYPAREDDRDEIYIQPFPGSASGRRKISPTGGRNPEWSRDGRELYFISEDNRLMVSTVTRTAAGGDTEFGNPRALFPKPLVEGATYAPAPDGRFLVHEPIEAAPPIYVLSSWPRVTGTSPAPPEVPNPNDPRGARGNVTSSRGLPSRGLPNADFAAALRGLPSAAPATRWQFGVLDRAGKTVAKVGGPIPDGYLALSPDGSRIASIAGGVLAVVDIASNTSMRLAADAVLTPVWSPDGKRIAYISNRASAPGVYVRASTAGGAEEMLYATQPSNISSWPRDAHFIGVIAQNGFSILSDSGSRKLTPVMPSTGKARFSFSPDAQFLAYLSNESGSNQLHVRSFDTDDPGGFAQRQISKDGATLMARWREDGREIYYIAPDGNVMVVPITPGPQIKAGAPTVLFRTPEGFPNQLSVPGPIADVSTDGQRFVFLTPAQP